MKIAVCYSGFLRDIQSNIIKFQNNVIKDNEVDYFIHTWDVDEYSSEIKFAEEYLKPKFLFAEKPKSFEINPYDFINSKITKEEYEEDLKRNRKELESLGENKKIFPPASVENNFSFLKEKEVLKLWHYGCEPYKVLSQYYSIHKSNELKKLYEYQNEFKYDVVIRNRTDICFNKGIDLSSFDTKVLNVFNRGSHKGSELSMCDLFAFSSSDIMNTYSDCFLYIPALYYSYNIDFIPEILLDKYVRINNIPINKIVDIVTVTKSSLSKEANL